MRSCFELFQWKNTSIIDDQFTDYNCTKQQDTADPSYVGTQYSSGPPCQMLQPQSRHQSSAQTLPNPSRENQLAQTIPDVVWNNLADFCLEQTWENSWTTMLALMAPSTEKHWQRAGGQHQLCLPTAQEKQRNVGIVIVHRAQEPVSDKSKHLSHSRSFSNREALRESWVCQAAHSDPTIAPFRVHIKESGEQNECVQQPELYNN